jgi:hypothetical protein
MILELYKDSRKVFRLSDIAMLMEEQKQQKLEKAIELLCAGG